MARFAAPAFGDLARVMASWRINNDKSSHILTEILCDRRRERVANHRAHSPRGLFLRARSLGRSKRSAPVQVAQGFHCVLRLEPITLRYACGATMAAIVSPLAVWRFFSHPRRQRERPHQVGVNLIVRVECD